MYVWGLYLSFAVSRQELPLCFPRKRCGSQGGLAFACDDGDSLPLGASIRLIVVLYAISDIQWMSSSFPSAPDHSKLQHYCHDKQLAITDPAARQ